MRASSKDISRKGAKAQSSKKFVSLKLSLLCAFAPLREISLFAFLPPNRVKVRVFGLGPASESYFLAGVKLDAFGALDVEVAEEGAVPAGEREPGHRGGHADVDADHAGVEMPLELAGGVAAAGEDGGAVAEIALIADRDCFIQIAGSH